MSNLAVIQQDKRELIIDGYAQFDTQLPVFTASSWEDHVQAWLDADESISDQQWRQAAVAMSLNTHYGENAVDKFAAEVGTSARSIRLYRQAYRLRREWEDRRQSDEFGKRLPNLNFVHFVYAANEKIETRDKQIEYLERAASETLSTRALYAVIAADLARALDAAPPPPMENEQIAQAWQQWRQATNMLRGLVPRLSSLLDVYVEEIQYELSRPSETAEQQILDAIADGYDDVETMARYLHKDRAIVQVWLNRMVEEGRLDEFEKGRAPGARGAAKIGYAVR